MKSLSLLIKSVVIASAIFLTSCSLNQRVPEVRLVGLLIEDATLFESTLQVEIRVENDNPYDVEVGGGVHKLYLNGEYVGKGYDQKGFILPRLGSIVVPVTVHINNISLLTKLQKISSHNKVTYKIQSTMHTNKGPFRWRSFEAMSEGSVALDQLTTAGRR